MENEQRSEQEETLSTILMHSVEILNSNINLTLEEQQVMKCLC
jgi:hypothetical protein